MYLVEFTRDAAKLPANIRKLIFEKITLVAADPHSHHSNVKRLQGRPEFRLRVQDWRVIYRVFDGRLVLLIIKLDIRGQVYK
jgi:mRNA interferase RelE/StbE